MKSEEIAVLRILYKQNSPLKLSVLIEGFPDEFRSRIVDAVSKLQLLSYINMTDCSSVLYVTINRQMRRNVLNLLESDSERYTENRVTECEIQPNHHFRTGCINLCGKPPPESDLKKVDNKDLWLRLPKRAVKLGTSILVFSFVILGTITALNSQSTTSSSTYSGSDEGMPFMIASSSSLATETQKEKTIPVEHIYNSEQNQAYSSRQPAIYEGIFTKLVSAPSKLDEPPLYYHYLISERRGLLLLEQITPLAAPDDSNSSLSAMSDNHVKEISST